MTSSPNIVYPVGTNGLSDQLLRMPGVSQYYVSGYAAPVLPLRRRTREFEFRRVGKPVICKVAVVSFTVVEAVKSSVGSIFFCRPAPSKLMRLLVEKVS